MNDELKQRYGPNWQVVQEYIEQVPCGFLFTNLGHPNEADAKVCRLRDWPTARRVSHYDLREGSPENSDYLRFLATVHRAAERNNKIARENSLSDQAEQATMLRRPTLRRMMRIRIRISKPSWMKKTKALTLSARVRLCTIVDT